MHLVIVIVVTACLNAMVYTTNSARKTKGGECGEIQWERKVQITPPGGMPQAAIVMLQWNVKGHKSQ
jgi:hypothetical protein